MGRRRNERVPACPYSVYRNAGWRGFAATFLLNERGFTAHVPAGGLLAGHGQEAPAHYRAGCGGPWGPHPGAGL